MWKQLLSILIICLSLTTVKAQNKELLISNWDLVHYTTIDDLKKSQQYATAEPFVKEMMDQQFAMVLQYTEYRFQEEGKMEYVDIIPQDMTVVTRNATWELTNDTILIKETDRSYERKALIRSISKDSLVLSPIIEGTVGSGKLVFKRKSE